MLQGVQSERGDGGGLGVAENAEHAAFLAQRVAFEVGISEVNVFQIEGAEVRLALVGVVGRALFAVHRASLLACVSTSRGLLDQLFQAVAGRLAVAIA